MSAQLTVPQQQVIDAAAVRLRGEFDGTFGFETVERLLRESLDHLVGDAQYTDFIPLLAERFARERLHAAARAQGRRDDGMPSVMFLCVQNAGRSQMAAGWLRHLGGSRVEVYSGGSAPGSEVNPVAVEAMAEVGIDISNSYPKPWTEETLGAADVIVTMGCGDSCPVLPGKRYLDWDLVDPKGKGIEAVRPIRDDIEGRVRELMAELGVRPEG